MLEALLLDAGVWQAAEGKAERRGPYVLGVDLGATAAMSAAAAYWPETGALDAVAAFPAEPGLAERGLRDGVSGLYVDCQRRGELIIAGQYTSDVGGLMREVLERWGPPAAVVADRWREGELREASRRPRAYRVLRLCCAGRDTTTAATT